MKVVPKEDSDLMKFFAFLLQWTTPNFLTEYATTIGETVYMPKEWIETRKTEVLRHEAIHVRQWEEEGLLFSITYLLPFFRALYELEAYEEDMIAEAERDGEVSQQTITWVYKMLTGPEYLWAWPFFKGRFMSRVLDAAVRATKTADNRKGL